MPINNTDKIFLFAQCFQDISRKVHTLPDIGKYIHFQIKTLILLKTFLDGLSSDLSCLFTNKRQFCLACLQTNASFVLLVYKQTPVLSCLFTNKHKFCLVRLQTNAIFVLLIYKQTPVLRFIFRKVGGCYFWIKVKLRHKYISVARKTLIF